MKASDIDRIKKAIQHLGAAQQLLLNIDWASISNEQDTLRGNESRAVVRGFNYGKNGTDN